MHDLSPSKILIIRTDRLGDVILSTPVATTLKKIYPKSQICFLVRQYTQPVAEMAAGVDDVIELDDFLDNRGKLQFWRLAQHIKNQKFDIAIHLHPRPELALAAFIAGIPIRIGTGYRIYSLLFNRRQYDHRKNAAFHEAELNLRLLRQLGIDDSDVRFEFIALPDAATQIDHILKEHSISSGDSFAVLHPGSGGSARDWPLSHFAELADRIAVELKIPVVLTGTAAESAMVEEVRTATSCKPVSLAGKINLEMLAALLKRAQLFVSNSTGPLHLAVAMGTEVVAFYPPITPCRPERWGPYGRRTDVLMSQEDECKKCAKSSATDCFCMQAITVEQAFLKVQEKFVQSQQLSNEFAPNR